MKQLFQTAVLDNDTFKLLWQQFFSNQLTDTQKTVLLSYCNWETLSQTQHRLIYTAWAESRTAWDWIGNQTVVDFNVGVSTNPNGHIYSLATALLLAGVGVPVVKTGDYGYGNYCGYSDILEYLGAKFARTSTDWRTSLEKTSFAYVHAPNAHRTLDALRTIRTDMGATTVLDTLQPLANVQTGVQLVVGAQTLSQQQYYNQLTTAAGGDAPSAPVAPSWTDSTQELISVLRQRVAEAEDRERWLRQRLDEAEAARRELEVRLLPAPAQEGRTPKFSADGLLWLAVFITGVARATTAAVWLSLR